MKGNDRRGDRGSESYLSKLGLVSTDSTVNRGGYLWGRKKTGRGNYGSHPFDKNILQFFTICAIKARRGDSVIPVIIGCFLPTFLISDPNWVSIAWDGPVHCFMASKPGILALNCFERA